MTLPDLLRKSKPAFISILAVLLCYLFQHWTETHVQAAHHLVLKHPYFPYAPASLYLGYLYGMRIGLFIIAASLTVLVVSKPELSQEWMISGPIFAASCFLCIQIIERLKRANEIERNQRKVQADFMTMLAHEFKNPLSVIETTAYSLSLLADSEIIEGRMRSQLRASADMATILNRLLEVDAVDGSKVTLEPRSFQVRSLLIDIIDDTPSPERIELSCVLSKAFKSDPVLLRRILTNLVDNALKYGPPEGQVKLAVIPQRHHLKSGLAFRCINEIGVAGAPDATKVFTKYYRASDATGISGAGVGLWLCKEFVDALSGVIRLELGNGQISFYVWIPDLASL